MAGRVEWVCLGTVDVGEFAMAMSTSAWPVDSLVKTCGVPVRKPLFEASCLAFPFLLLPSR